MSQGMSDPDDYILDLSGEGAERREEAGADGGMEQDGEREDGGGGRPFLSILFKCCNAYARVYKTVDGKAYAGHCPRCARAVRVGIGPGGSAARFFTAE